METYFRNPINQYVERGATRWRWLWALIFGPFYFVYKGMWAHAAWTMIVSLLTALLANLIYALIAPRLVNLHYRRRGWIEVTPSELQARSI